MPNEIFHLTSAGSVDDGKSTILARLLLDTGSVYEDQLGGIDPRKVDATTIADLLDGLESEREQGITIDVAHRFFDSKARRYHLADSPGHEQYTRNMATAASHADGMLLVVDVRTGVKPQTKIHFDIALMLGIKQFVVAVNKMDLVGYKQKAFEEIRAELDELLGQATLSYDIVPVSGLAGDNIVKPSKKMRWWGGTTILSVLEQFATVATTSRPAAFAIQMVQRVPSGGRRYLGSLLSGAIEVGGRLPSPRYPGRDLSVLSIAVDGEFRESVAGPSEISIEIDAEVDLDRGDVLGVGHTLSFTDEVEANLVWLDDNVGFLGRTYLLRSGHQAVRSTITRIFRLDHANEKAGVVNHVDANDVVSVNLETHERVSLAQFADYPELGRFVLVDPQSGITVAAGVVNHVLRRAENLVEHVFEVGTSERSMLTGRQGRVVWFTGLSGSGKSTLASAVSVDLTSRGIPHGLLDGDSLRLGLNRDLGFSEPDRIENIRRTAEVAKLMADSGLVVLVSLISPYRADRARAREIVVAERFVEVFVDTPMFICEQRDAKGLYAKARQGSLPDFTGISAPYEPPEGPSLRVDGQASIDLGRNQVVAKILSPAAGDTVATRELNPRHS
jgi:bifunctional enzyme CysN/CysC